MIEAGRERGFIFDEDAVRAVMRAGENTWLLQGADPLSLAERLFAWTPFRVGADEGRLHVDWCHLAGAPYDRPVLLRDGPPRDARAVQPRLPANATPIDALAELPPGLPIAGFIFHMSRCGSTLVSQALAAFESNIVLAEAAPIRSVLQRGSPRRAARHPFSRRRPG